MVGPEFREWGQGEDWVFFVVVVRGCLSWGQGCGCVDIAGRVGVEALWVVFLIVERVLWVV